MRYRLPDGGRLKLMSGSGSIHVIAEDRDDVEIDQPRAHVDAKDHILEVRSKSGSVTARCPTGTRVYVGVISGSVRLEGTFASAKVSAISGSIHVDSVRGDVDVRSVSGSLSVESCGGNCCLNTKSGRITVGHVGKDLQAATISGTIEAGTGGEGTVEVKTISEACRSGARGTQSPSQVPHSVRPCAMRLSLGRGFRAQGHNPFRIDRDYKA
jgi:DUF4097 and DUF4098 domain-containing protein YvlB